jgi:hypothetical protein
MELTVFLDVIHIHVLVKNTTFQRLDSFTHPQVESTQLGLIGRNKER